jgi:hypothetical protein
MIITLRNFLVLAALYSSLLLKFVDEFMLLSLSLPCATILKSLDLSLPFEIWLFFNDLEPFPVVAHLFLTLSLVSLCDLGLFDDL